MKIFFDKNKAEFPYESFKSAVEELPIYTQIDMDKALSARDKEWVEWIEKTFCPDGNWSDRDYDVWQERKKEIEKK